MTSATSTVGNAGRPVNCRRSETTHAASFAFPFHRREAYALHPTDSIQGPACQRASDADLVASAEVEHIAACPVGRCPE
jgi:hypothetical protein